MGKESVNVNRKGKTLTYEGKTLKVSEWARHLDVDSGALYARLRLGWGTEKILTTPIRQITQFSVKSKREYAQRVRALKRRIKDVNYQSIFFRYHPEYNTEYYKHRMSNMLSHHIYDDALMDKLEKLFGNYGKYWQEKYHGENQSRFDD